MRSVQCVFLGKLNFVAHPIARHEGLASLLPFEKYEIRDTTRIILAPMTSHDDVTSASDYRPSSAEPIYTALQPMSDVLFMLEYCTVPQLTSFHLFDRRCETLFVQREHFNRGAYAMADCKLEHIIVHLAAGNQTGLDSITIEQSRRPRKIKTVITRCDRNDDSVSGEYLLLTDPISVVSLTFTISMSVKIRAWRLTFQRAGIRNL